MTCRQTDSLLCEYLDGTLPVEQHRAFEQHLGECPVCAEALADSRLALGFVHNVPSVEPPVELIADIIHDTIGVRGTLPVLAPVGGPAEAGLRGWLRPIFNPLLQPRFAMSMVMAVLSLSMLTFYAKNAMENWQPGQSKPVAVVEHVGDQFRRAWEATTEFFETVRGMYQLQREFATEEDVRQAPPPQAGPQPGQPAAPPADPAQANPVQADPAQADPAEAGSPQAGPGDSPAPQPGEAGQQPAQQP